MSKWCVVWVLARELYLFIQFFSFSGCILGPDGGFGGRSVQDGVGVCLPSSQMWCCGFSSHGVTWRSLPPLRHSALWTHCHRSSCGVTPYATTQS